MKLTITISGLHGTGKSTYARILSKHFGLRHVSAGDLFRQIAKERGVSVIELSKTASESREIDSLIDERTRKEAETGDVIIDGFLAGWMAGDAANLKIQLIAPESVRIERIARRDRVSYDEARAETLRREKMERERFRKVYKIDINNYSIYDLVLNTGRLSLKANVGIIRVFIQEYIKLYGGK